MKRIFDMVVALLALLLLWPVLVVVALWVKWDSNGPVLYRQLRVGRYGKPFEILKFRSMTVDQPKGGLEITVAQDPRITKAGAWIRRTKLDELPQLVNVLRGDMSLVGPRPEVPKYVQYYSEQDRLTVLSVRPGITDRASIEFRHESELLAESMDPEATYREVVLPQKLAIYREYVRARSFIGDLTILWQTLIAVMRTGSP